MMTVVRKRFGDLLWMLSGAVCMLVMAPIVIESLAWLRDWHDTNNPPVSANLASAEMVSADTLRLRLSLTRQEDCEFVRLLGFSGSQSGPMQLATTLRREDGSAPVSYPVGMTIISQPWLMSPIYGPRVLLYGYYDCDSRIVRAKLLDHVLGGGK